MELGFNHRHYVPVLRWKPAEIIALANTSDETLANTRPLVELLPTAFVEQPEDKARPRGPTTFEEVVDKKVTALTGAMRGHPVLVDLWHVPDTVTSSRGDHAWDVVREFGLRAGLRIVPVTGFRGRGKPSQQRIGEVVKSFGNGCSIRLLVSDLSRASFESGLEELLRLVESTPQQCDLIVDLQYLGQDSPSYGSLLSKIPRLSAWRSLTVLAGAFPVDLSHLKANNTYRIERLEWITWRNEFQRGFASAFRMPSFGDYTIQHAIYREPVSRPHVSASIRYTADSEWIILRGEWIGKIDGLGSAQYPAEAKLIVEKPEYSGEKFSFGDGFIYAKSRDGRKPGNATQWLTAGINHHVTLASVQVRSTPEAVLPPRKIPSEAVSVLRR